MAVNTDNKEKLYEIISEHLGVNKEEIHAELSLCLDLGVAGDDGEELIERLSQELKIDFSEIELSKYFGSELVFNPYIWILNVISGEQKKFNNIARTLTVGHLERVCKRGRWFEPTLSE